MATKDFNHAPQVTQDFEFCLVSYPYDEARVEVRADHDSSLIFSFTERQVLKLASLFQNNHEAWTPLL